MSSSFNKIARDLAYTLRNANTSKPAPYDTQAEVRRIEGNTAWVHIPGGIDETPVQLTTSAKKGDIVQVRVSGGRAWLYGNQTNPPTDDTKADEVDKKTAVSVGYVDELNSRNVTAESINAATDYIDDLYSKNITTENLKATTGYIQDLTSENITTDNLKAATGYIQDLTSKNITTENLKATTGYIQDLTSENITTDNLKAATGYIQDLTSENITASDITADHATVGSLDANYAQIDMANVNNAWIENGAIKKAEVFDENVFDLSGNRATLSRIDASKINVANLRADNLVVRRINGQPVVGGYTLISNTSPGYDTKNPQALGWYEFSNGQWVLSTDTTVDENKAYYQEGDEVSLYDQAYIDGLENGLQQQIDGAVETFTGSVVPTLVNYPYNEWYDTSVTPVHDERAKHVGDIYYVVNSASDKNGYCYRFAYDNTSHAYSWVLIKDSDVTKALSDISDLQTFESETTSWIDETDQGLETIRTNHTSLVGVVNKTVKESIQLWFTKANTTAPSKPTAEITSTSTAGNAWRKVVPAWDASYPNYYYCWQYKFVDGTFGWSDVIRDIAMGETQGMSRDAKNTADAALPASTFESFESTTFTDLVDEVDEQSTTMTNMTTRLGMNADGTGSSTDIVSKESALEQTVGGISSRVSKTETKLAGMYAISSTAAGTAAKVATITPAIPSGSTWELGTGTTVTVKFTNNNTTSAPTLNINSTGAKAIKSYSGGNLSEAEYKWKAGSTFTFTYNGTNWLMQDSTASVRMNTAETTIEQTANNVLIKASQNGASAAEKAAGGQSVIQSLINVAPEGVQISAEKVNIAGAAIFNSYSTTTEMNTAIGNAVNNIEIGGKNILSHSGDYADWIKSTGITTSGNVLSIDVTGKTSNVFTRPYGFLTEENLTEGTIVVSFEVYSDDWSSIQSDRGDWKRSAIMQLCYRSAKDSSSSSTLRYAHMTLGNYGTNDFFIDVPSTMTDGEWIKFVTRPIILPTDFVNDASKGAGQYISVEPCLVRNGHIKFRNIKVEKGTKATDWSPAPEDVTEAINTAQTTANAANNKVVTFRGTCSSGWTDGNKVVSCTGFPTTIPTGAKIDVYCYSANNASTLTLNVNNSGAKTVKVDGVATGSTNQLLWFKGVTISFTYDGSSWLAERPTSFVGGTCSTAAAANEKVTLIEMPVVQKGTQITVPMTNFNTAGAPKLKLQNSAGTMVANDLYFGSGTTVPTQANGFSWPAGANVIFTFDGQYWKFGNQTFIDGGNILTGTISADRIGANSLKIGKIDTTDANTVSALLNSSIQIGGGNLLLKTKTATTWTVSLNASNYMVKDCYKTVEPIPTLFNTDDHVTVSFDWSTTATSGSFHLEAGAGTPYVWGTVIFAKGTRSSTSNYVDFSSTNQSGHCEITFRVTSAVATAATTLQWFRIRIDGANTSGTSFTVSNAKAERGNKATDWSPAPEDLENYADAAVDAIDIGGTNLLRGTKYMRANSSGFYGNGCFRGSGQGTLSTSYGFSSPPAVGLFGYVRVTNSTSDTIEQSGFCQDRVFGLVAGETYTMSCWIRSSVNGLAIALQPIWISSTKRVIKKVIDETTTTSWQYISYTGVLEGEQSDYYSAGYVYVNNLPAGATFDVCGLKLERGNKATAWSKSPEDDAITIWADRVPTTNLDYYTVSGEYYCRASMTNAPVTNQGKLLVNSDVGTTNQQYHLDNKPEYYTRTWNSSSSSWTSWTKVDAVGAQNSVNYYNRSCHVGNSSNTQTNYWRKFASYTDAVVNDDPYIIFDVTSSGDMSSTKKHGRLKAHVRTTGTVGTVDASQCKLEWLTRGEGISLTDFVLAYKATSGTSVAIELWCRCPTSWIGYRFSMVEEGTRTTKRTSALWTLHDSFTANGLASVTSGYTQVTSTDIDAARTTATDYIFDAGSNGIWVTPSDKPPASDGTSTNTTTGWHIADALELVRNGITYIWAGLVNNIATVRVGKETGGHSVIDEKGMRVYGSSGGIVQLANIGYGEGTASTGTSNAPYYTLGKRAYTNDSYDPTKTYKVGDLCLYDNGNTEQLYVCIVAIQSPEAWDSTHWQNAIGNYSLVEGGNMLNGISSVASGSGSHAEGRSTRALGYLSHTEGLESMALAEGSHAEGWATTASGEYAHVEGEGTRATGVASHSQNHHTIASKRGQTALGAWNEEDVSTTTTHRSGEASFGKYAVIVGNGINGLERSNALTVDWGGKINCGDYSGNFKSIFDIFYPVGSYYETSLASAIPSGSSTPNIIDIANLGVTWFNPQYAWGGTWELELAGQVHVSSGTGYAVSGAETNTSDGGSKYLQAHTHTAESDYYIVSVKKTPNNGISRRSIKPGTGTALTNNLYCDSNIERRSSTGAVSGATTGSAGNMPPYIVVNRWHRTA